MPKQTHVRSILLLIATCAVAADARADFDAQTRSINGTGETLPEGDVEVGIGSVAYGVTSNVLVQVPTLSLLVGYGVAEVRIRERVSETARISSFAFVETPRSAGVGTTLGFDFGTAKEHSLAVGARVKHGPIPQLELKPRPAWRQRSVLLPSIEYDFYHRGNVVYAGTSDYVLYGGYTWAWTHVRLGVITSPASKFLPFPYIYWRF